MIGRKEYEKDSARRWFFRKGQTLRTVDVTIAATVWTTHTTSYADSAVIEVLDKRTEELAPGAG
jgi:hypothetical protein